MVGAAALTSANHFVDSHFKYYYPVVHMVDKRLGDFEFAVLSAILRLGPKAYGVAIREEIEMLTGRMVSAGALYTTLRRLEAKKLVKSKFGKPTRERGGRAKRFYVVEPSGRAAVKSALLMMRQAIGGVQTT